MFCIFFIYFNGGEQEMNFEKLGTFKITKDFEQIKEQMGNLAKPVIEFQKIIKESMSKIVEPIKRIPSDLSYSQKEYLFEKGWYLSQDISIDYPGRIRNLIDEKKDKELEKLLIDYTKSVIPEIKEKVQKSFPNRKKIVDDALKAHEENRYILSIPLLLIQAEGICREIIDISPFLGGRNIINSLSKIRRKIRDKLEKKLNQYQINGIKLKIDSITEILLQYLSNETDIITNIGRVKKKQKKDRKYQPLNRNYIIHGWDVDYASEVNSYKAISFLNFIIDLKHILKNIENQKAEYERIIKHNN